MQSPTQQNVTRAPEARYVNYFEVGHNAFEFILDFGQYHPEQAAAHLHTRLVTGPVYAKLLSHMLAQAVERHEREFGVIPMQGVDPGQQSGSTTVEAPVRRAGAATAAK